MPAPLRGAATALAALEDLADAGLPAQELIEEATARIDRVVPSDGFFVGATDPQTTLCLGPGVVHDLPADQCQPTWDYEFLVPDVLKFTDIARGPRPVGCLHEVTGGRPERSPRWREFGTATGFRSELRAVFGAGDGVWGVGQFDRLGDGPRFSSDERAWLEQVAPVVGRGLRKAMVAQPAATPADRGPGVLVLDAHDTVVSATPQAEAWINELEPWLAEHGTRLPFEAHGYIARARDAALDPGTPTPAPGRLRTASGVWLRLHAEPLAGSEQLAVVVEPARAGDVAPLIVEAYGLTDRELEVTRAIARGLGTAEIAALLVVSPHTVRDHVKSVFEKVGVSSRGELVAKVFAEHYSPLGH